VTSWSVSGFLDSAGYAFTNRKCLA